MRTSSNDKSWRGRSVSSAWACGALALLGVAAVTLPARPAAAEWEPISQRTGAGVDMYWWSSQYWGSTLPVIPFVHFDVTRHVWLDFEFPFSMWIDGFDDTTRAALGNPTFGAHYAGTEGKLSYYLGGRISAPLGAVDDADWQGADNAALIAMAGYGSYLYATDYLPLSGNFGIEYQPVRPLYLRVAFDPVLLFKLSRGAGDRRNAVVVGAQQKFEIEGRADVGVGGGFALNVVSQWVRSRNASTMLDDDRIQLAAEPFFSFDRGALFLRLGVLIALDEPLGFGFDETSFFGASPKVATGHFQIGGRF